MDAFADIKKYFTSLGGPVPPDAVLMMQLRAAKSYIMAYCNRQIWPEEDERLLDAQLRLAVIYCNQMGVEGQSAHSEGGVSRSFSALPESMQVLLQSLRLVPMVQRPEVG